MHTRLAKGVRAGAVLSSAAHLENQPIMFSLSTTSHATKAAQYDDLLQQARSLIADERDFIANAANFSSLVYHTLPDLNWVGFYLFDGAELVVGPFQGKPACVRIALGRGVCGTAARERRTQVVPDVHAFPGHIACDSASRLEIVVPLISSDGALIGVWDVDSPVPNRFDDEDALGMEALCTAFVSLAWKAG
ncbi:Free methionine-(R)-sulfoxide reductase, contains GAF domain [Candidatus Burkholderia humilis]|nr:Free methionine-(R)-sulfoxide reductase, contains GAF domain [Candidatus Burkholderia humilis]